LLGHFVVVFGVGRTIGVGEFWLAVVYSGFPAGVVELVVVGEAEHDKVVEVCSAAVRPVDDVVGFASAW
jgi:hypothetical protein